jgi:hypothetical protein
MPGSNDGRGGSRPGQNGDRPTNQRYSASKRWEINSAKRIGKHLRTCGPLNPRRKGYKRPEWQVVEEFLTRMQIAKDMHLKVYREVRHLVA